MQSTLQKVTMIKESFWQRLQEDALHVVTSEPLLASYAHACILNHRNFESALSFILSNKLADEVMPALAIRDVFMDAYEADANIIGSGIEDIKASYDRDPAVHSEVCAKVKSWLESLGGWRVDGIAESPITGPEGNKEFLIGARKSS